ncbi:unnamed protein product [Cuscuta europaea]|uniref:Cell wall protein n=1 Tax=Cuscuta europaea TaxID=41803 RepID=A0A9P0Z752_CUSEU|nr:unnamed protein product [Cuscuta europaea]
MAETRPSLCTFLLILFTINVLSSLSVPAMAAGRGIPNEAADINGASKNVDEKLHPEFLHGYDGTVLIPGFGRVVIPPKGKIVDPFNYNPITGKSGGGTGAINPFDGIIGGGSGYVPGGDDTLLPNPGVEVPNPPVAAGGGDDAGSLTPPARR